MKNPLHSDGIHYFHDESNFQKGYAIIFGPKDTLYENGIYFFDFNFPDDYPFSPPKRKVDKKDKEKKKERGYETLNIKIGHQGY